LASPEIDEEAKQHADAGGGEAPMPAEALALPKSAADDRPEAGTDVDAHVEDREPRVAPRIALAIDLPDHGGHVRLEEAGADDDQPQADVEHGHAGEREGEVTGRDDQAADDERAPRADEPIGDVA